MTERIIDTGTSELICIVRNGVAVITLNRPDARNALSDSLTPALRRMIRERGDDPTVGALVITGAGNAFCSGGDVKGMGDKRAKLVRAALEGYRRALSAPTNWSFHQRVVRQAPPFVRVFDERFQMGRVGLWPFGADDPVDDDAPIRARSAKAGLSPSCRTFRFSIFNCSSHELPWSWPRVCAARRRMSAPPPESRFAPVPGPGQSRPEPRNPIGRNWSSSPSMTRPRQTFGR